MKVFSFPRLRNYDAFISQTFCFTPAQSNFLLGNVSTSVSYFVVFCNIFLVVIKEFLYKLSRG